MPDMIGVRMEERLPGFAEETSAAAIEGCHCRRRISGCDTHEYPTYRTGEELREHAASCEEKERLIRQYYSQNDHAGDNRIRQNL